MPEPSRRLSWSYSIIEVPVRSYTRRFRREIAFPGHTSSARAGLNPNPIINCRTDALPGSEVLLRRLNRDMAEQKLDLIQFTTRIPTEPRAGSSQIVRCKGRDTDLRSGRPDHVPYGLFADAIPEHSTRTADTAKDLPAIDRSRTEPGKLGLHRRHLTLEQRSAFSLSLNFVVSSSVAGRLIQSARNALSTTGLTQNK
jgi:hypothetical protein